MAIATLYADGVASASNVSGTLADYTADDGTYGAATEGGATDIRLDYPTPVANPLTGANAQTVEWDTRKVGGTNSPAFDVRVYAAGVLVSTLVAGASPGVGSATFTFSGFAADGSDFSIAVVQTGGHTGNSAKKAWIETDYLRWVVETESPSITEVIGVGSISLSPKAVVTRSNVIVIPAIGSFSLTGKAVVTAIATTEIIVAGAIALTGRAVTSLSVILAKPLVAAIALTGHAVGTAGATVEVIGTVATLLTGRAVGAAVASLPASGIISISGLGVQTQSDVVVSLAANNITLSGQDLLTQSNVAFSTDPGAITMGTTEIGIVQTLHEVIPKGNIVMTKFSIVDLDVISSSLYRDLVLAGVFDELWKELVHGPRVPRL